MNLGQIFRDPALLKAIDGITAPFNKVANMTEEQLRECKTFTVSADTLPRQAFNLKPFPTLECHACKKEIKIDEPATYFEGKNYHTRCCAEKWDPVNCTWKAVRAPTTVPDVPAPFVSDEQLYQGGIAGQGEKWSAVTRTENHELDLGDDVEVQLITTGMPKPTLRIAWTAANGENVVIFITGKLGKLKEMMERAVSEVREKL